MYDIVYTLIPVFLYFVYVRYRSHLDARRIPSQLSTGSIRQPSELGLVGGGQAGSEAPAGFVWWFLLNDFSLRMVSLRCPYLFFFVKLKPTTVSLPFFGGGYVDWPGKWWLLSCFRAETCWNQHLIVPCSLRQWLDTSQPGALKNAGSVFVSISVIKGQVFFLHRFWPILTDLFVVIWLEVIFSHTYDLQRQYQDEHPGKFALHRLPRGKAVSFGNSCFLSFW